MLSKTLYFGEEQVKFLENLKDITFSEHVRRAVDVYIDEIINKNVSESQSKVGDDNG